MDGHIYYKCPTPQGRMVRVDDEYLNAQGIWLKVSKIFKSRDSADILVEFVPLDSALAGRCWQGEFLVPCSVKAAARGTYETGASPCVYVEDLDAMTSAEDVSAGPGASSASSLQAPDAQIIFQRT